MKEYIRTHQQRFIEELMEWLRIPSISTDAAYADQVQKAADYLQKKLLEAGADKAEVYQTSGHPIVYAEKIIDSSLPTVLVYGHYDVQPADPLNLWDSPPFEPVIKNTELHPQGAIFARGACDDKGQVYMHVKALETMLHHQATACNIKMLIEGEEESGSVSIVPFIKEHRDLLSADVILISDTTLVANDVPSLEVGLRGLAYLEVEVTGPNRDLHSGVYGGAVANPINVLCEMIASLKDDKGRITIPGFYDKVATLSGQEREALNQIPFDLEVYKKDLNIKEVAGEEGYTTIERTSIRPTLDVNGIWGGYIEKGAKTVLPSKAYAKISMRLVPNQNPDEIAQLFTEYFTSIAPASVQVKVTPHHGGLPYLTPTDSVEFQAAAKAFEEAFGKKPLTARGGGSIPIVALFEKELGVKSVLMGFGLDSDAIHSPNEHYGIFNFLKGIETIPLFYKYYAELKGQKATA